MLKKVREYVSKWQMLKKEDGVIVGVSGGADSVCLLFVLLELQKEIGFRMVAVHVNHRLRGEAADADESYVKKLCARYGVLCETYSEDVELFAKKRKQSTEEAGREVRRMCFEKAMKKHGGSKIALAHHQNDSAETFLFHLARGTGLKGLGGISPVKGEIIRPLLCVSRKEIETYLKGQGISYCTDQTNASDVYTRNRVRNHVISYMEKNINEKAVAHMNDTMEHLRQVQEYLEEQVQDAWGKVVVQREGGFLVLASPFQTMSDALKPLLLKKVLTDVAGREKDLESVHLRQLQELFVKQSGRKTDLPYDIEGKRIYEGVLICKKQMGKKTETEEGFCLEGDYGQFEWQGKTIQCRVLDKDKEDSIFVEKSNTERFDYDIMKNNISFRTRRPGDYITIHPDGRTQKLKAYFINEKIPQENRDDILLVADGSHIIWVVGYRVNPLYRIHANTKRILEIQIDEGEKMAESIRVMISEEDVDARIEEMGKQISKDYEGKQVHLICILKGSVFFVCELAKRITVPVSLDFMSVSSYGDGTASSGIVKIAKDLDETLEGKDVLIVEDIIDSGRTLYYLMDVLEKRNPKSLKLCTLLDKPNRRVTDVKVDYVGFEIPDEFVVGYGLDYAQKYRNLPYIGVVEGVE